MLKDKKNYIVNTNKIQIFEKYKIEGGDDGLIKINNTYLPLLTDIDGYTENIVDFVFLQNSHNILVISESSFYIYKCQDIDKLKYKLKSITQYNCNTQLEQIFKTDPIYNIKVQKENNKNVIIELSGEKNIIYTVEIYINIDK